MGFFLKLFDNQLPWSTIGKFMLRTAWRYTRACLNIFQFLNNNLGPLWFGRSLVMNSILLHEFLLALCELMFLYDPWICDCNLTYLSIEWIFVNFLNFTKTVPTCRMNHYIYLFETRINYISFPHVQCMGSHWITLRNNFASLDTFVHIWIHY